MPSYNLLKETLVVWWDNQIVGRLRRPVGSDDLFFTYDQKWLDDGLPAISLSLPLTDQTYSNETTRRFFANFTPEGDASRSFALAQRISQDNLFKFFYSYGAECAGALMILDEEFDPSKFNASYRDITDILIKELSLPADERQNLILATDARLSLAGAQNKLPVIIENGRYLVPAKNSTAATTHIIKPAPSGFKNMPYNEAFCMELAAMVDLPVAKSEIANIGGVDVFLTVRYDRRVENGSVIRLHQEDFCQAMGVKNNNKYQEDGGPGIRACVDLLLNPSLGLPRSNHINFAKLVLFNFIIGNCDAHGKNFSLLRHERPNQRLDPRPAEKVVNLSLALAPFYDLLSTMAYPRLTKKMAMSFGKNNQHGRIGYKSYDALIEDLRLEKSAVLEIATELTSLTRHHAPGLAESYANRYPAQPIFKELLKIINANCLLLDEANQKLTTRSSS
jgi:serine/threonine-protein kinase HipA